MAKSDQSRFRFRKLDNIGAADAESDNAFLTSCFVDSGEVEVLRDCGDHRRIIVGRTGTGKTALIRRLTELEERVIQIQPESLSLAYISNSTILAFLSELGVKLDIFFRLLWRHVFTVEILKHHFHINSESAKRSFLEKIGDIFKGKKQERALKYLENWGKSFWEETEYRIKELTTKLEKDLKAAVSADLGAVELTVEGARKLSEEQKREVITRAQHVVNEVQIRELSEILELIDEVLTDRQKRYYITIDRLDEDWIEERLRFRLIRALIETVRDFQRVRFVKIIVALRLDLLDRVFRFTRDAGFQEEKYESLNLHVEWTPESLVKVLNTRIEYLIKQRYTKQKVTCFDLLPRSCDGLGCLDYLLSRTLMRPRDLILFFNACILQGAGRAQFTAQMIKDAEGEYSRLRLRAIADEWHGEYPNLMSFVMLLRTRKKAFKLSQISQKDCEDSCLDFLVQPSGGKDALSAAAINLVEHGQDYREFKRLLFHVFYRVGLIGLKLQPHEAVSWVISGRPTVSLAEIGEDCTVEVHSAFWRVLGAR